MLAQTFQCGTFCLKDMSPICAIINRKIQVQYWKVSEFDSLEHDLYKLIELLKKNSKYHLLWHNIILNKSHVITRHGK